MNNKLQTWALVAEIVGGIAIVISLVFVGLQVRMGAQETAINTSVIRTQAYQDLTAQLLEISSFTINDAELYKALNDAQCGNEAPEEVYPLSTLFIFYVRHADMAHYMYREGLIDEERLIQASRVLTQNISNTPRFRGQWRGMSPSFNPDFVAFVNSQITEPFTPQCEQSI